MTHMAEHHVEPADSKKDAVATAQLSKLYTATLDDSRSSLAITGGVCYCCKTALAASSDASTIYLAWRHVYPGNFRDIAFTLSRVPEGNAGALGARVQARMKLLLGFVDTELANLPYFVGAEFTAADVMMAFPLTTMRRFLDYDIAPYPNIAAYVKRIEARPAYQKAMALAGPDAGR